MATPHVTGAIALVWDAHPTWSYQQVIAAVLNTADRIPSLTGKVATGRLDVGKAITYGDSTPTPTPTPTPTQSDTTPPTVAGVTFSGSGSAISQARVTFSEPINAATFGAADVTLTGPGGQTIGVSGVTAVAGTTNQFDVTFATQTAAGTYTLAIGPAVNDLAGNAMARRATATTVVPSPVSSGQTFTSTDAGQTIWDFGRVASAITVNQDIAISDLNVTVNVSHTYDSDLRMSLVGPDGTVVPLVNRRGGSGDNFRNTTFDDEAGQGIWQAAAPFAGSVRPEDPLSAFDGKSAKGTWYLVVEDTALFDTGRLNGWSMSVQGTAASTATVRQAAPPSPPMSWVGPTSYNPSGWQGTAPFFYC
jgi:subtilisin-like proprotein convertase family protein